MAIFKDKIDPKRGYTVISNQGAVDGDLSLAAKGLLYMLFVFPPSWNVSCSGLAKFTSNCKDFINRTMRELEAAHYVKIESQKRKRGRFGGSVYHLINYPGGAVSPDTVLPYPTVADTVTPDTVSAALLNTNKSITEELNTDISIIFSAKTQDSGKKEKFTPPGVEEVRDFCLDRGISVDAEHFVNYYTANGWHIGRSRMKDWRSAVICWEKNGGAKAEPKRSDGGRYEKRKEGHMSSFDAKDFFEAALRKSYAGCKAES